MKQLNLVKLAILLAVSLIAAVLFFLAFTSAPYTLVLQLKSLEKGKHQIGAIAQSGRELRIPLEIGSDSGESSIYAIELPGKQLKNIIIPPLASPGRYEIERITLGNRSISFRWDGSTVCRSRIDSQPVGFYTPCTQGAPVIISLNDTITISEIPSTGVARSLPYRLLVSILGGVLIFLAGVYLLRATADGVSRSTVYIERAAWLLFICLYLYQLAMLWGYSVDLPFWEEWEFFEPTALQRGLTLEWLFCHFGTNQQVVVFTKLMAWLDFKLFSLDFAKLKLMNYLVFGLFLLVVARFARQVTDNRFWSVPLFMLFLLSPLAYEAHAASFQSGEIFVLLFSALMLCFSAPEKPGLSEAGLFSAAAIGAIFSMHTGVAVAGILLIGRTVFIFLRVLAKNAETRTAVIDISVSWLITLAGIGYWLSGFRNPTEASVRLMPTTVRFWEQFLELLSFGFGLDNSTALSGLVILFFLLVPLLLLIKDKASRLQRSTWQILQGIVILLAIAAMITFGRGATFTTLKLSRYTVYITPLILFGALAWGLVLQGRRALPGVLAVFWIFCFAAFSNNWSYGIYRDLRQMDLATLDCIEAYNSGKGDGNCPDTHGVPIGVFFDNARKLEINFTRQFARPVQPK